MTKSTVTLLGTLRELHQALPGYDLKRLGSLVAEKKPDLLCVEIDRHGWESNDLQQAPIEDREVLAPLTQSSEITLIPIGGGGPSWDESGITPPKKGLLKSFRRGLSRLLNSMTVGLMRLAGGARTINSPIVEHTCGVLCELQVMLTDTESRRAWTAKNQELLNGILWTLQRDPGRRVVVAVDCRRKHWLRRQLKSVPQVMLVDFWKF